MKNKLPRIIVQPHDVKNMLGLERSASSKLLNNIRKRLNKEPKSWITYIEFSQETKLPLELVMPFLE